MLANPKEGCVSLPYRISTRHLAKHDVGDAGDTIERNAGRPFTTATGYLSISVNRRPFEEVLQEECRAPPPLRFSLYSDHAFG